MLCAIGVVFGETSYQLTHSSVVLMCVLDCTLLAYVVLTHKPSRAATTGDLLGKVSLLKIPLMVVHSASAKWFDTVCLSAWLVALLLRDILFMIFMTILFKCICSYVL